MADLDDERLPSPRARSEWELMDDLETPLRPFRTSGDRPFLVLSTDDVRTGQRGDADDPGGEVSDRS